MESAPYISLVNDATTKCLFYIEYYTPGSTSFYTNYPFFIFHLRNLVFTTKLSIRSISFRFGLCFNWKSFSNLKWGDNFTESIMKFNDFLKFPKFTPNNYSLLSPCGCEQLILRFYTYLLKQESKFAHFNCGIVFKFCFVSVECRVC